MKFHENSALGGACANTYGYQIVSLPMPSLGAKIKAVNIIGLIAPLNELFKLTMNLLFRRKYFVT